MRSSTGLFTILLLIGSLMLLNSCSQPSFISGPDTPPRALVDNGVAITLRDQKLTYIKDGKKVREYPISSSKYGISGKNNSYHTPYGLHTVRSKVGEGHPIGAVFKGGRPTGEVVPVNAKGRDPIVTRVIFLDGHESDNSNSKNRRIYIHGTPEERKIGSPASYGCIRMRSRDIIDLYRIVRPGTPVLIDTCSQKSFIRALAHKKRRASNIPLVGSSHINRNAS